jgi:hypothetical protein
MASGHNRVKRPDTWLHRPMLQNVKKVLANPEPSTHDPSATSCNVRVCIALRGIVGPNVPNPFPGRAARQPERPPRSDAHSYRE